MKFTTVLVSALGALTAVAAVPLQYDETSVFARSDDGELFIRFDEVAAFLEARGSASSKNKGKKKDDRPPSYTGAARDPVPSYRPSSQHAPDFHSTWDPNQPNYEHNKKSATGHNRH